MKQFTLLILVCKCYLFREYLGESNPWYCPKCQHHQTSAKHMSVTKWPDVLIVHLKR